MLGIILGVSSLVAMSALVAGMEKGAKEALVAIGGLEKVRIEPQGLPIEQRHLSDQAVGITMQRCACPAAKRAAGHAAFPGDAPACDLVGQRQNVSSLDLQWRVAGGAGDE